jgi:CBS domain-containing protein
VGEVCSSSFLVVPRRRRIVEVARMMGERWASSVIVIEEGRPIGIITKRTIINDVLARGYTGMEVTAGDVFHTPIATIDADASIQEAATLMADTGLRYLAVTRGETVIGLLSHYHLARVLPQLLTQDR